ncbi:hypothetical protein V1511DRAFT_353287 [Dipodascopsis uninucleata]
MSEFSSLIAKQPREGLSDGKKEFLRSLGSSQDSLEIFQPDHIVISDTVTSEELNKKIEIVRELCWVFEFFNQEDLDYPSSWNDLAYNIIEVLCENLRPLRGEWIWRDAEGALDQPRWILQTNYRLLASQMLKALAEILTFVYPDIDRVDFLRVVKSSAIFLNSDWPWSSKDASKTASKLLEFLPSELLDFTNINSDILKKEITPIFKSSRVPKVSGAGRFSIDSDLPMSLQTKIDAEHSKWTSSNPEAAPLFLYIITTSEESFLIENWSLIVPATMLILGDANPNYKAIGAECIHSLISKVNIRFLNITGLLPLFWDSLVGCLSYLPLGMSNITIDESIRLLDIAYDDLILLASIRARLPEFVKSASLRRTQSEDIDLDDKIIERRKSRLLDLILINGIYMTFDVCGDKVELARLLISKINIIVTEMGIFSIKHLKSYHCL